MITLLVHYEVAESNAEEMERLLAEYAELIRANEPDCLTFQSARDNADPNTFYIWEVYRDQTAYDFHARQPYMEEFARGKIRPLATSAEGKRVRLFTEYWSKD